MRLLVSGITGQLGAGLLEASGQSSANTSQHLLALHGAGMLMRTREGTRVRYELAGEDVLSLWLALRDAAAIRIGEVARAAREYLGEDVEALSRDQLAERMRREDLVVVDVRPEHEYRAGHIPGARSIPIDELEQRLAELPTGTEIVAYCRGPFCAYAHDAVRTIRSSGRDARRLDKGWPEWQLAEEGKTNRLKNAIGEKV